MTQPPLPGADPGPAVDTAPFSFPGGTAAACLLLHGLTGTPHEMRFLGAALARHGFAALGPRLPGHGTSVEDLARTGWRDWRDAARESLRALRGQARDIVVVGQSMGALLALDLAADSPDLVRAVVVLSPALVLAHPLLRFGGWMLPLALPLVPADRRYVGKGVSDIADARARAESPNYRRVPLAALAELRRLQRRVRGRLGAVRQPVLAVHARQDHTCPVRPNLALLAGRLGGPLHARVLTASWHVVSVDVEREEVAELVAGFVADATAGGLAATRP